MVMRNRHGLWRALVVAVLSFAALAYLRDPPWLLSMSTGFSRRGLDPHGTVFRWIAGRASFFVPSDARTVDIPLRTTFDRPGDLAITVTVTIDDRPADRLVLTDATWRHSILVLPRPGGRRVRRIDLSIDRVREEGRGVLVGEVVVGASRF
jgi:hypothetical protein